VPSNELQLNSDGSLDYKAVLQGDPTVPLHRIAYIFLRDALNQYLSVPGNSLPLREPPGAPTTGLQRPRLRQLRQMSTFKTMRKMQHNRTARGRNILLGRITIRTVEMIIEGWVRVTVFFFSIFFFFLRRLDTSVLNVPLWFFFFFRFTRSFLRGVEFL
jgi:hypothetical protein